MIAVINYSSNKYNIRASQELTNDATHSAVLNLYLITDDVYMEQQGAR